MPLPEEELLQARLIPPVREFHLDSTGYSVAISRKPDVS